MANDPAPPASLFDGPSALADVRPRVLVSERQSALWRVERLLAGSPLLNRSLAYRLAGPLAVDALREAVDRLVARHQVLATIFRDGADGPVGVLGEPPRLEVREAADQTRAAELVAAERLRPFELTAEPLFRALLVPCGEQQAVLLFTLHLVVCDRRSLEILVHDVSALYEAAVSGSDPQLPELPFQYAELAAREAARTSERKADARYWRERLRALAPVVLPADREADEDEPARAGTASLVLGSDTSRAVDTFNRRRRSTVFVTLATALLGTVHRFTGQEDLCLGTALENRSSVEVERLIGPFSGGILLRVRFASDASFGAIAASVHRALLEGMQHQTLPFDELVRLLERDGVRRTALGNLTLDVREPRPELELRGVQALRIEPDLTDVGSSVGADLHLDVRRMAEGLVCEATYNASRSSAGRVSELLGRFEPLLCAGLAAPDDPLEALARRVQIDHQGKPQQQREAV